MPLSVLSPYAPPFVPGSGAVEDAGGSAAVQSDSGNSEAVAAASRAEDAPDVRLWMWGDGSHMMPLLSPPAQLSSPSFFLPNMAPTLTSVAQLPPFLPQFSALPYQSGAVYGHCNYGAGPPVPPPTAPFPLCPDIMGGGRRKRRKHRKEPDRARRAAAQGSKESEQRKEADGRAKLFRETAAQTQFSQRISEATLQMLPSSTSELQHPLAFSSSSLLHDRCEVTLLTASHRTVSVTTDTDLLQRQTPPSPPPPPLPPSPPPPATRPRVNYAAVVKAPAPIRTAAPPAPVAVPVAAAASTPPSSSQAQTQRSSSASKRRGKKKVKTPHIDLQAVMAEREAQRAAALLSATGGAAKEERQTGGRGGGEEVEAGGGGGEEAAWKKEEAAAAEFPGLLASEAKRSAAEKLSSAWRNFAERSGGSSTVRTTPAANVTLADFLSRKAAAAAQWREAVPESVPQQASAASGTGREKWTEGDSRKESLPFAKQQQQHQQQQQQQQQQRSNPTKQVSRVKFRPLFSIGGGSTQAELYRPKDPQPKPEPELEICLQPEIGPTLPAKPKRAGVEPPAGKKVANPLDSTGVTKRGKERENPRPKRPSLMKKIILKERQEKRRARERPAEDGGHQSCPENAKSDADESDEEDEGAQSAPEDAGRPIPVENARQTVSDASQEAEAVENTQEEAKAVEKAQEAEAAEKASEEAEAVENAPEEAEAVTKAPEEAEAVPASWETLAEAEDETSNAGEEAAVVQQTLCSLHSRRFREYCNQMIGKEINECVLAILSDLVRFQDRLHQRDPVKARQRRRLVCGLKEVTKHLKLKKLKLVIMSPDVERIESKGGLDDAVRTILSLCEELSVPYVFSLPRRLLGKALLKPVPIAVVGIFNYEGTEAHVRRLSGLVEEGRAQYRLVTRIASSKEPDGPVAAGLRAGGHARTPSEPISELSFG